MKVESDFQATAMDEARTETSPYWISSNISKKDFFKMMKSKDYLVHLSIFKGNLDYFENLGSLFMKKTRQVLIIGE
jgi:archaellum biogenesis ATPase FlaH